MNLIDIETALARYFNYRTNIIVPNVSWGMFTHECDLLVLTPAGYATEVEIKTNKYDLLRDKKKKHGHHSTRIKFLYFAIPEILAEYQEHIPDRAGIITLDYYPGSTTLRCKTIRNAKRNSDYKFSAEERYQLARLGTMRIWTLKNTIAGMSPLSRL